MSEVLVYAATPRQDAARTLLGAACKATGIAARLEVYGTGTVFQRLGRRHRFPLPDLVLWFGPFAARAASVEHLVQPYQPARFADGAHRDADWGWTAVDYSVIGSVGPAVPGGMADLLNVPRLAMADPERSEVGMGIVLASFAKDGPTAGPGWEWWTSRGRRGLQLTEDDTAALAAVSQGTASHALTLSSGSTATPVSDLPPLPHALSLAANAPNADAARHFIDWLVSPDAASLVRYSPWQAGANGLKALFASGGEINVNDARLQYVATRERWAASALGPTLPQ
jgi:ABC-type Fe3+ transport system substrate-binding protein